MLVLRSLVYCLKINVDLFAIFFDEIFDIDPDVTCHQLNIYHSIQYVAQRKRQ